ncbi:substrate-binding domain-containing protein [Thermodesulfovibrionales bacterium]|nr:substrate-binding domain-containing protein [Thermodesulfovibrionales bacterium]
MGCVPIFPMEGISVVVHPANPVSGLSREQIRGIYAGKIVDWREVGDSPKKDSRRQGY